LQLASLLQHTWQLLGLKPQHLKAQGQQQQTVWQWQAGPHTVELQSPLLGRTQVLDVDQAAQTQHLQGNPRPRGARLQRRQSLLLQSQQQGGPRLAAEQQLQPLGSTKTAQMQHHWHTRQMQLLQWSLQLQGPRLTAQRRQPHPQTTQGRRLLRLSLERLQGPGPATHMTWSCWQL
jgi:hypothetical protein